MFKKILSIQIVRQLLGAAGGALVALSLFTVYRAAAPLLAAHVFVEEKEDGTQIEWTMIDMPAVDDADIFDPDFELGSDPVFQPTFADPTPSTEMVAPAPTPVPVPAPTPAPIVFTQQPVASPPPVLPSSGIGMGLSVAAAMGLSAAALRMRKRSRNVL